MKNTLKTFPKKRQAQGQEYFTKDVDEWLEHFEAELLDKCEGCPFVKPPYSCKKYCNKN